MKKKIIIISSVVLLLAIIITVTTRSSDNTINIKDFDNREVVSADITGNSTKYLFSVQENKYLLEDANTGAYLSGMCTIFNGTTEECESLNSNKVYLIFCNFDEHSTKNGTEYFFKEDTENNNGFVIFVSEEGNLKDNLSYDINEFFF